MYKLKGFINIPELRSNVPGVLSVAGEISSYAMTFSREKGVYTSSTYSNVVLMSLLSTDDDAAVEVPSGFKDHTLQVCSWVATRAIAGQTTSDASVLLQALDAEFTAVGESWTSGPMVEDGNGYWFPSWLTWSKIDSEDNELRLWFVDESIRNTWDEFAIVVIPPVASVDSLFGTPTAVQTLVSSRTPKDWSDIINAARGENPYTALVNMVYNWHYPSNTSIQIPTTWAILAYGPGAQSPDAIKQAVRDYILDETTHLESEWIVMFPEIFRDNEFLIVPRWDNIAIPQELLTSGVHSPTVLHADAVEVFRDNATTDYTQNHVEQNLCTTTTLYKSLGLLITGNSDNFDGIYRFDQKFPKYIVVPTTSLDFNKMDVRTKNFVLKLTELLMLAEEMTTSSSVPLGFMRIVRGGLVYAAMSYENLIYMAVTKESFVD